MGKEPLGWLVLSLKALSTLVKVTLSLQVYLSTLFLGMRSPPSGYPILVHILLPETDNCPS